MLFFLIITILIQNSLCKNDKNIANYDNIIEDKVSDLIVGVVKCLEGFNDRYIGGSEFGDILGYKNLKPTLNFETDRGMKKMSMAMMPLVFHVGATSTWMLLSTVMAAKSLAIGLLLLIFKIAVSSAKVASFFTLLKTKTGHHHDSWNHHGDDRSFTYLDVHNWNSYVPEWTPNQHSRGYKTISSYKENEITSHEKLS